MLREIEEEYIKAPQHKLQGHDKNKTTFLEKQTQELNGKGYQKKDHDGKKKEEERKKKEEESRKNEKESKKKVYDSKEQ